jgi:MFS family permease
MSFQQFLTYETGKISRKSFRILALCMLVILYCIPGHTGGICPFTEPLLRDLPLTRHDLSSIYALATVMAACFTAWGGRQCDVLGMRKVLLVSVFTFGLTFLMLSALSHYRVRFSIISDKAYWFVGLIGGFTGLKFLGHNLIPLASRAIYIQWFPGHRALAVGCSGIIVTLISGFAAKFFHWGIEAYGWQWVWGSWWILSWVGVLPVVFFGIYESESPVNAHLKTSADSLPDAGISPASFVRTVVASWEFWMLSMGVTMQLLIANGISFHIVDVYREFRPEFRHVFDIFIPVGMIGAFSGPFWGWLLDRISMKWGLLILYALQLAILGSFLVPVEISYLIFVPAMGFSWSLYGILLTASWPRFVPYSYRGRTSGWVYTQTMLGGAIGPWLLSFSHLRWGGYLPAMKWLMLWLLVVMVMTVFFVKREILAPKEMERWGNF